MPAGSGPHAAPPRVARCVSAQPFPPCCESATRGHGIHLLFLRVGIRCAREVSTPGDRATMLTMTRLRPPRESGVGPPWWARPSHALFGAAKSHLCPNMLR